LCGELPISWRRKLVEPAKGKNLWKLAFQGKTGGYVVLRGRRSFIGNEELYPPAKVEGR